MNVRFIALAAAVAGTLTGTVVSAQQMPQQLPQNAAAMRGDRGSDRSLRIEIRRLEGVIDMLQRDRHDYGGHRVQAIEDLQRAREQLEAGLHFDNNH
ncbi:MAG: hypothetical protein NVS3B7_15140 [Candidatus Elarobacter sp.]